MRRLRFTKIRRLMAISMPGTVGVPPPTTVGVPRTGVIGSGGLARSATDTVVIDGSSFGPIMKECSVRSSSPRSSVALRPPSRGASRCSTSACTSAPRRRAARTACARRSVRTARGQRGRAERSPPAGSVGRRCPIAGRADLPPRAGRAADERASADHPCPAIRRPSDAATWRWIARPAPTVAVSHTYHAVFTPSEFPFKRISALDWADDGERLAVFDATKRALPVVGAAARRPDYDAFWGSIVVDLEPDRWGAHAVGGGGCPPADVAHRAARGAGRARVRARRRRQPVRTRDAHRRRGRTATADLAHRRTAGILRRLDRCLAFRRPDARAPASPAVLAEAQGRGGARAHRCSSLFVYAVFERALSPRLVLSRPSRPAICRRRRAPRIATSRSASVGCAGIAATRS